MKKMIIGIHGLGNKPPANILKDWWLRAMREGLTRLNFDTKEIPFELVFWADILHPELLDTEISDKHQPGYVEEPYVPGSTTGDPLRESLRAKLFKYVDKQLDSIFLDEDMTLNLAGVTDVIIRKYFGDLGAYFQDDCVSLTNQDCSARKHIQDRLLTVLKKYSGYDILLVGHSMGSIVAFDILSRYADELKINTFVTIGSPLGLPFIMGRELARQRSQNPDLKRPMVPESIQKQWINLADIEDKVAMDHALNDDYLKNQKGVGIEDHAVYNDYAIDGKRNPHKSFGYLRTPEFSGILEGFLTSPSRSSWRDSFVTFVDRLQQKFQLVWNQIRKKSDDKVLEE
ncbi:MAG: lipase family protein [Candidatus Marinimicrobia bacterium]|nr:lipase family protein [Candidatus Neomarinimicrobiota bacterium]